MFDLLGRHPDVDLTVFSGGDHGSLEALDQGQSFKHVFSPVRHFNVGPLLLKYQQANLKTALSNNFDVVILSWDAHYLSLWPAIKIAKFRGRPKIVLWGHGYSKSPGRMRTALRNFYGRRADAVLLYSRTIADKLVAEKQLEPGRVFIAQNALDQSQIGKARERWLRSPEELQRFQERYQLNPLNTLAFVSRLEPENHVDMLIRALEVLRKDFADAKLIVIGDGRDRSSLLALVRSLNLEESVIFAGAIYREDDIAPWLLSATAMAYPCNIGLSLHHAFGYGLPVITSGSLVARNAEIAALQHGPEYEALVPGNNGLVFERDNVKELANRCRFLFENPDVRNNYSLAALHQVNVNYTLDSLVRGFHSALNFVWPDHNPQFE